MLVQSYRYRGLETSPQQAGEELTRGESSRVQRLGQVGLVLVKCTIWIVIFVVPHLGELSEGSGFDTEEPSGARRLEMESCAWGSAGVTTSLTAGGGRNH